MLGGFQLITEGTCGIPSPFPRSHNLSSEHCVLGQLPHEDFDFERDLGSPNPSIMATTKRGFKPFIHRFSGKFAIAIKPPVDPVPTLTQLDIIDRIVYFLPLTG